MNGCSPYTAVCVWLTDQCAKSCHVTSSASSGSSGSTCDVTRASWRSAVTLREESVLAFQRRRTELCVTELYDNMCDCTMLATVSKNKV